jgi:branched-subunit amino acid ABC-type transport system permease component
MVEFINNHILPALVLGCVYTLGAIAVSLIFSILRFAHFAHGDMMTIGGYFAFAIVTALGLPALAALPFAAIGTIGVALAIDRWAYKPFRRAKPIIVVIASFGIALVIRSAVQLIWGVQAQNYTAGVQQPMADFAPIRLFERHLYILATAVILVVALHLFLTHTKIGKAMRAMSDDADLARVTGIDTERVVMWTWAIGATLAAAAGVLIGMDTQLTPLIGWDLLLPIFAAAILGGLGRPYGAILGGLVIGALEELSTYPWFGEEPLLSPGYKQAVAFLVMIAILIWRPQGILRGKVL